MLTEYGWDDFFEAAVREQGIGLPAARVIGAWSEHFLVASEQGVLNARLSGRLRYTASDESELPVTGDWVYLIMEEGSDTALIYDLLPRRTLIARKRPGADHEQVLAANIDTACIVSSMDETLNLSRVERFMALVLPGGAEPLLIFNKSDLCPDPDRISEEIKGAFPGRRVLFISAATGAGFESLEGALEPGRTVVFLGQSGAGKSSIINRILGQDTLKTSAVRESDSRGTHTTTSREIILTPGGTLLMDTPGIREAGLWCDTDIVEDIFEDISELAEGCRFSDCTHTNEPGCAVLEALENGDLDERVYRNYIKLMREALAVRDKSRWKDISREIRRFYDKSAKYQNDDS